MPSGPRKPLPPFLQGVAFTVAQGQSVGLGQGRLRGPDLERPFHGIRIAPADRGARWEAPSTSRARRDDSTFSDGRLRRDEGAVRDDRRAAQGGQYGEMAAPDGEFVPPPVDLELTARCSALLVAAPEGAFFSHLTAARLWPLQLPRAATDEPVQVSVVPPQRPPRRAGVVGHQVTDPLVRVVHRLGIPVVDPATLFCQLAARLSLHDLVAVGDALVLKPVLVGAEPDRPWVSVTQLTERVEMFRGRGKRAAAAALALIRPGAESRPETLLRLAIMDAGLPEGVPNDWVYDARGRLIGRGDLVYRRWRVIAEYDGDQHRTSTKQFDKDVRRLDDFTAAGWRVVRITGRSFFRDRRGAADRVGRALFERGWRP